jgi:TPR repeat protein/tRNA A-37 threonylcarbamoyl transferase component Bud32
MPDLPEAFAGLVLADRYEITSLLGQGQGGMVFKARHRQLDRMVAVKLFSPEALSDKTAFMRFEREAHSVGRLNHPNIVTVFDLGRWKNERPFLVMDYIEGLDLQDITGKEGRMHPARVWRIGTQVCSALFHAHKRSVIHRDLKPRNIMVLDAEDLEDFVKLVDFGIAKQSDQISEGLTMEGYVMGTPQYMSPEQCIGTSIDLRTDIYSLCSVLFKMITGTNPIGGSSLPEIMNNQIHQKPMSFEEATRGQVAVPPDVQRVIYKGLAKNPADRQQSMAQLRLELNEAFGKGGARVTGQFVKPETRGANPATSIMDELYKRANAGDAHAQFELVLKLEIGQGCPANPAEASRLLKLAAQSGMKEAQYRLGDHYLRGEGGYPQDNEKAIEWLRKSAEQNYDAAQFALGWCYEFGLALNEDLRLATTWYQKAAKQGNHQADERLNGLVERLNQSDASLPDTKAATTTTATSEREKPLNNPEVLYAAACRARDNAKSNEDRTRAAVLFQQAAHHGHELAGLAYAKLLLADTTNPKGQSEAVAWLEYAQGESNQIAMLMLAACLRNGIGCTKDAKRAQELLESLAREPYNMSAAQATIGTCLLTGDGVQRNIPRGITLLKAAAESGDPFAQWKLGICLRTGVGVTKDTKAAETMFQKSAEAGFPQGVDSLWKPIALPFTDAVQIFRAMSASGNTNAFFYLGICYENGYGVERDLNQALQHYGNSHSKGAKAIERIKAEQQAGV